ncbi:putative reverse transcriptase domain-containing protein [Tanacetum coccineum]
MTITHSGMTHEAIEELVNRRVEEALVAYEAIRAANAFEAKSQSQNGNDDDNGNGNGRNENPNENGRGDRPVVREYTYQDFIKCQPLNFKGTEGVVGLIRWFEKMETMFHISNYPEKYQVKELMKVMAEVYCPKNEIQKMGSELWNLIVKNNDMFAYTKRFQELTMLYTKMVPEEEDRVERYIGGLSDNSGTNIRGQNVARAYMAGNNERKLYNGPLPLCNKCKLHHEGPCTVRCGKCNKVEHLTRDCKLKDQNCGNKTGNKNDVGEARGKAHVLGRGDTNPDLNVVKGTFLIDNHYASMIFDLGADRSFVSTTFSTLLDVPPDTLDISYAVELADGRIFETNTVLRGCTFGLLGHPFNIDLILVELGSFDIIIGMDWLANHHALIVCDERIIRIPYGDEVLIVRGDRGGKGEKLKLSIIFFF